MRNEEVADLLEAAARIIETEGWKQGGTDERTGPCCLAQAIERAFIHMPGCRHRACQDAAQVVAEWLAVHGLTICR